MSLFATLDGVPAGDVATNSGWRDFTGWVSELENVSELRHLVEYGWSNQPQGVAKELTSALKHGDPSSDQSSVGHGLLEILQGSTADVLVISDGIGTGRMS